MDSLGEQIRLWALRRSVSLLALPYDFEQGFESVVVKREPRFYGIRPEFDWKDLSAVMLGEDVRRKGVVSDDFADRYLERALWIASDMRNRAREEGFPFYNGSLAKLIRFSVEQGTSVNRTRLSMQICGTSYFTALGTNICFDGYGYQTFGREPEPALPENLRWAASDHPLEYLAGSPLANQLAVHIVLHNDREILYVRRGRVGQQAGLSNSTANGAMEFALDRPDESNGVPDLGITAQRETEYELGVTIKPENIKWLGLMVTHRRNEPAVVGACRIDLSRDEVAMLCRRAPEAMEVEDKGYRLREKRIQAFITRTTWRKEDISLLGWSQTLLIPALRTRIQSFRTQLADERIWTAEGATAFVLCLAHLHHSEWVRTKVLA